MCVHIDDLLYDLLEYILEFLPEKQLFIVERVSRKWQKCVLKLLEKKKNLKRLDGYSDRFKHRSTINVYKIINDDNIDILKKILTKCPNIKTLNLSYTRVTGNNILIEIAKLCNKIESIDFIASIIDVSESEMDEFGKILGPQLINFRFGGFDYHFDVDDNFFNNYSILMLVFLKHVKNVEEFDFQVNTNEQNKEVFEHLDSKCKNLKSLTWDSDNKDLVYQDEHLINVMQKIQYLDINLSNFLRFLSFKFDLNNLTELSLGEHDIIDDNKKIEKTFVNLTKLCIRYFNDLEFDLISKFKFPKLDSLKIYLDCYRNCCIPTSFINQIKHIKSLEYDCLDLSAPLFLQLNKLTNLVCNGFKLMNSTTRFPYNSLEKLIQCFDTLLTYHSLKNITFTIDDSSKLINKYFFEKLVDFNKTKTNTKIIIKIPKKSFNMLRNINEYNIGEYEKLFEEARHLHKLNMKLIKYSFFKD